MTDSIVGVWRVAPLTRFILIACVFEVIALIVSEFYTVAWVLDILICLVILYLVVLIVRGLVRQSKIEFPEIMSGKVVRKRHWHLF